MRTKRQAANDTSSSAIICLPVGWSSDSSALIKMNVLQERYQFHHRHQKQNESVEDFAAALQHLATFCRFESQKESLIRDHVLYGLKSKRLSMQIIRNGGDPSLSDVIDFCVNSQACRATRSGKENSDKRRRLPAVIKHAEPGFQEILIKEEDIPLNDAEPDIDEPTEQIDPNVANSMYICEPQDTFDFLETTFQNLSDSDDVKEEMIDQIEVFDTVRVADSICPVDARSPNGRRVAKTERPAKGRREKICSICGKHFAFAYNLKIHMYTHTTEKPTKCPLCPRYFKNKRHLRGHTLNKHTIRPQVECPICRKIFKSEVNLQMHKAASHPPAVDDAIEKRDFECYTCHKLCISELQLRRHMYTHVRARSLLCTQCGKCFVDVHKLNRHLNRSDHHQTGTEVIKPFKCTKCAKAFVDRYALRTHAMIHSEVAQFGCGECGKHFKTRGNLQQHQRTHVPERYFCQYCDHKCRSSGNLQKHMKVHTGR